MGLGLRVFVFDENGIRKISYARFQRLLDGHEKERLPEYAGKKIKYALTLIQTENRKPIEVLNIDLGYIYIEDDGKLNQNEFRQKMADAMKSVSFPGKKLPLNVIDASATFAAKRYRNKHTWAPSQEELNKIYQYLSISFQPHQNISNYKLIPYQRMHNIKDFIRS